MWSNLLRHPSHNIGALICVSQLLLNERPQSIDELWSQSFASVLLCCLDWTNEPKHHFADFHHEELCRKCYISVAFSQEHSVEIATPLRCDLERICTWVKKLDDVVYGRFRGVRPNAVVPCILEEILAVEVRLLGHLVITIDDLGILLIKAVSILSLSMRLKLIVISLIRVILLY